MLPAGQQDVSIEVVNAAGRVIDTIDASVNIIPQQLSFLTRHWIAPAPVKTYIATSK